MSWKNIEPIFEIGNKVLVRKDIKIGEGRQYSVITEMMRYAGKYVTIEYIDDDGIRIEEDTCVWERTLFEGYNK